MEGKKSEGKYREKKGLYMSGRPTQGYPLTIRLVGRKMMDGDRWTRGTKEGRLTNSRNKGGMEGGKMG